MNALIKFFNDYFKDFERNDEDTNEYIRQRDKYLELYDNLFSELSDEHKEKLCNLSDEHFMLDGISNDDGFNEGTATGFKLAIRLILDCMKE